MKGKLEGGRELGRKRKGQEKKQRKERKKEGLKPERLGRHEGVRLRMTRLALKRN